MPDTEDLTSRHWPKPIAALGQSGFGLLLFGQAMALQGTWIQGTAQRWLVLELSDSPWIVGLLGAATGLPVLLFAFWAGWLSDRLPKISVIIGSQGLILLQALALGWLIQIEKITVPEILGLAFLLGSGMAAEVPARQSLIFDLVGRDHITNALALHSTAFNLARFAGPAIAGVLMAHGYLAMCFYVKALSALIIIGVLAWLSRGCRLRRPRGFSPTRSASFWHSLRHVLAFVAQHPPLRTILGLLAAFGILCLPYSILLPSFGRDLLGLGAKGYGVLCSANGLGALAGALIVAIWGHRGERRVWWWSGATLFPLSLMLLSLVQSYAQALCLLFLSGIFMVITSTSAISLLQLTVADELRGQIMGLFSMSFMGLFPLGSLIQGALAQTVGVRETMFGCAFSAGAATILLAYGMSRRRTTG